MTREPETPKLTPEQARIAIKESMIHILSIQTRLRSLDKTYKWSNIFGDYGEMLAVGKYNLTPAPASNTPNYDAKNEAGQEVQIKTCRSTRKVGFREPCKLILVSKLTDEGEIQQIYYGPFQPVFDASDPSGRDNKRTISIAKLKKLAKSEIQIPEPSNIAK